MSPSVFANELNHNLLKSLNYLFRSGSERLQSWYWYWVRFDCCATVTPFWITVALRRIMEAIFYMLATGCQWRQIPKEFAPFTAVQGYFYRFCRDGTLDRINIVSITSWSCRRGKWPDAGRRPQPA